MEESADIVVKNILPDVTTLKIKSARVNLNFPVHNLKNYSININAAGSTLLLTEEIRKGAVSVSNNAMNEYAIVKFGEPGSVKFTSNVGDVKGVHTLFDINCPSCHISFK